jgi:hypothetical protein
LGSILGLARGKTSGPLYYNLGVAPVDAKGTTQDYLTHPSPIPAQIMAANPVFSEVVKTQSAIKPVYDDEGRVSGSA